MIWGGAASFATWVPLLGEKDKGIWWWGFGDVVRSLILLLMAEVGREEGGKGSGCGMALTCVKPT
jgi:hypothetical protein